MWSQRDNIKNVIKISVLPSKRVVLINNSNKTISPLNSPTLLPMLNIISLYFPI